MKIFLCTLFLLTASVAQPQNTVTSTMTATFTGSAGSVTLPPGSTCMGWEPPNAYERGLSSGVDLMITTPLTAVESAELGIAREELNEAQDRILRLENRFIATHHVTGIDKCQENVVIRMDDYYITDFVPENRAYPGGEVGAECSVLLAHKRAIAQKWHR